MKAIYSLKWVAFLAIATAAVAAQDANLLRRELKAGAAESYKIENEMKQLVQTPAGEMDMIITTVANVSVKTNQVNTEKGTADIEALTKVTKLDMTGSLAQFMGEPPKLPAPKTEKGTLDSRNRLVIPVDPKAKPTAPGGQLMSMGMAGSDIGAMGLLTLIELPEKPVKLGDSIEVAMPGARMATSMGVKDPKLTMKLTGEKEVDGVKMWVVSYTGEVKLDLDSSKMSKETTDQTQGQNFKMTGTARISGEGLVDKATGKTISNTLTVNNDTTIAVQGQEIPMKGTITMKLSLAK